MDVLMSLWQGEISSSAFVCCERTGLSTLAPYRGKYLKTLWQTRRCKTVTQDLCHTQPRRFMDCQDQPQRQGGIGTGMCCSLWDVWKDMGSMQEFPQVGGKRCLPGNLVVIAMSLHIPSSAVFPHLTWVLVLPNFNTSLNTWPMGWRALQKYKISENKKRAFKRKYVNFFSFFSVDSKSVNTRYNMRLPSGRALKTQVQFWIISSKLYTEEFFPL